MQVRYILNEVVHHDTDAKKGYASHTSSSVSARSVYALSAEHTARTHRAARADHRQSISFLLNEHVVQPGASAADPRVHAPPVAAMGLGTSAVPTVTEEPFERDGMNDSVSVPTSAATVAMVHARRAARAKLHECGVCARRFVERSNLKKHIQGKHRQVRPHMCEYCGKKFSFTDGKRRHVNNTHLGLRPYACHLCNSAFKQRAHLQKHVLNVHKVYVTTNAIGGCTGTHAPCDTRMSRARAFPLE